MKEAYLTYGPPGCGKTTFVLNHELYDGHNRVNMDEIRKEFAGSRKKPRELWYIAAERLENLCKSGVQNIFIDNTHIMQWQWDIFANVLTRYGYRITLVYFDLPLEVVQKQNASTERSENGAVVPPKVVEEFFHKLTPLELLPYRHDTYIIRRPKMGNCNPAT